MQLHLPPPLFSSAAERDKLEARVSCTLYPCVSHRMKQRQHFIRLGCKSHRRVYQRGVFAPATANSWNDSSDLRGGRFEFLEILSSVSNYRDKCSRWNQHRNISLSDKPPVLENLPLPSFFFLSSAFHQLSNATFFYFSSLREWLQGLIEAWREGFFFYLSLLFSLRFSLGVGFLSRSGINLFLSTFG